MGRQPKTSGLLPLPSGVAALRAELARLDRELGLTPAGAPRRVLAMERRRTLIALELEACS